MEKQDQKEAQEEKDQKQLKQKRENFRVDIRNQQTKKALNARRFHNFQQNNQNQNQNLDKKQQEIQNLTQNLVQILQNPPSAEQKQQFTLQLQEIQGQLVKFSGENLVHQLCQNKVHLLIVKLFESKYAASELNLFLTLIKILNNCFEFSVKEQAQAVQDIVKTSFFKEILNSFSNQLPQELIASLLIFISNIAGEENREINDFILQQSIFAQLKELYHNNYLSKQLIRLSFLLFRNVTSNIQHFKYPSYNEIFILTEAICSSDHIKTLDKESLEDLLTFLRIVTYEMDTDTLEMFIDKYPLIITSVLAQILTENNFSVKQEQNQEQAFSQFKLQQQEYFDLLAITGDILINITSLDDDFVQSFGELIGINETLEFLFNQGQLSINLRAVQIIENLFTSEYPDQIQQILDSKLNEHMRLFKMLENFLSSYDKELVSRTIRALANLASSVGEVEFIKENINIFVHKIIPFLKDTLQTNDEILYACLNCLNQVLQRAEQNEESQQFKAIILGQIQIEQINKIFEQTFNKEVSEEAQLLLENLQNDEGMEDM
ncbi:Armadillo-type fold [Pseudocohnilembus persalinus]|uniref:Armadillo-type fold n=1 Tax=Pseudocohnilembus persalinus TaxID=266149 RepID=A0A0V0Q908_PSEPJ|nr:Armadillo-type fold [Pseudocohnilembus persalinus]|eukprot:KRW98713.1 Armadillo-type fold [Pseudocohnilembus persalinus]